MALGSGSDNIGYISCNIRDNMDQLNDTLSCDSDENICQQVSDVMALY